MTVSGASLADSVARSLPARVTLSAGEARLLALRAQGLAGPGGRRAGVAGMVRRVGAVQLDTISVLARSHELVAYARLGAVGRRRVEQAYWGGGGFEYWAHAACVLPIDDWPWLEFRRRWFRERGRSRRATASANARAEVLARLHGEGPCTATQLGGARAGGTWWSWSQTKLAVERLLDTGDVVCVSRSGWRRVYDLAERAVPPHLLAHTPTDPDCLTRLVAQAGAAMGVATMADLADYYRLGREQVASVVGESGLVPVEVAGWNGARASESASPGAAAAWADPGALAAAGSASGRRLRHRTTLLSPFDSLIWDRPRTARIFGFTHRLEAYVPAAKRVHGYYTMPVLAGGRLVARVDPKRDGSLLRAKRVFFEPRSGTRAVAATAAALREAANWVGSSDVEIGLVWPKALAVPLRAALR